MTQPRTGLLSPTSKSSTAQMSHVVDAPPEIVAAPPPVVLRYHPDRVDHLDVSLSSSCSQEAQKAALQRDGDGKTSRNTSDRNCLHRQSVPCICCA